MEIIKIIGLHKTYGNDENKVEALKDVSFTLNKGDFVAIVGESGSGKSTLLHLLGGLDKPTAGKILVADEDISQYDEEKLAIFRRRKIGFIFQLFNLLPILNVEENIVLPSLLDSNRIDKPYLDEIVEILGLSNRKNHLPSELSGGQQQRVAIGRALLNKPSLILADEPTGNLDKKTSKEVVELLKFTSKRYKQTLVMITHDLHIASMADRIITLEDGIIISDKSLKY